MPTRHCPQCGSPLESPDGVCGRCRPADNLPTVGMTMATVAFEAATSQAPAGELDSFGNYQIQCVLGEGGMGTVYRAEQTAPIRRMVALKVVKAGMDSSQVLSRFAYERQALAMMDHPHIA
ncbi:MAG TPA: hypothetical protein VMB03_16055, partial [Bryobacteraceae bacterium]|nr:hypothetical protein [Bryobacteraceae bacterium]